MNLADKKVLVTGGAGFLGAHIINQLLACGMPAENIFSPKAEALDLRTRENCEKAVAGRNLVIHAAAITGNVVLHQEHPGKIFYDNLMMGVELMEAARKAGVEKFVTIGSATEYPDSAKLPFREEDLWVGEVEPLHAPYTVAKKMLLVEAQAYRAQYGFNAVHVLLSNMYGPGEHPDGGPVPSLIQRVAAARAKKEKFLDVWGTGTPTRDFLYVEDAADGIIRIAEKYDKPEPINLGTGREISMRELAETIMKLMDFDGEIRFDPTKPDGQKRRLLDPTKAEREAGFKAVTELKDGLRKTIMFHGY